MVPVRSISSLAGALAAALLFNATVCIGAEAPKAPPKPLDQVAKLRVLSREEASSRLQVKLRGVVAWQSAKDDSFVLHDGSSGVLVKLTDSRGKRIWEGDPLPKSDTEPGATLVVEGVTDPGGYSPTVVARKIERVGTGVIPRAFPSELTELFTGAKDSQRVQTSGVVQRVTAPTATSSGSLLLSKQGHLIPVQIERWQGIEATELLDATVRVSGIFAPASNLRAEMLDLRIKTMGRDDIEIVTPPPADPFGVPKVPLDRIQVFSRKGNVPNRKVTEGTVTFSAPGRFFFIQEGATGVRVQHRNATVQPGERVEVAAFVDMSRLVASLSGAVVRSLGRVDLPAPLAVTAEDVLNPPKRARPWEAENDCDGRLIKIHGLLRRVEAGNTQGSWQLEVDSGHRRFPAMLLDGNAAVGKKWEEGSELELTGVCELTFVRKPDAEAPTVSDFRLWLRSLEDVRVLTVPSWWTSQRLTVALVATLLVLLLAAGWIAALRRAVRLRAKRVEEVMRLHRDSELEYQATVRERQRLAADLHDGLQQMIAGATFRLEAAVDQLPAIPPEAQEELTAARRALLHTQTELRDCLWGLRNVEEGPGDFAALLRHAVGSIEHWPGGSVIVDSKGEPFELSRDVMGNLLLLMQEAVGNAFRHGHARLVRVELQYDKEGLELRIEDDGEGFTPALALGTREGHFGLEGMRERMRRLRGSVEITSAPGRGACVRARISRVHAVAAQSEEKATTGVEV